MEEIPVKGLRFTISHAKTALFWSSCVKIKNLSMLLLCHLGGLKQGTPMI